MNKTILTLIERASRKGVAKAYSYRGFYGERQHVEKYRVIFKDDKWSLYHYGTLTATTRGFDSEVVYGESRSDIDSINTFLTELTGQAPEMHYYPSKDIFTVVDGGKVTKQFYRGFTL